MADRHLAPDTPELRARWSGFAWSQDNARQAKVIVARYPDGRQRSAVMPIPVMDFMCKGDMLPDPIAILVAHSIVFGECDR